MDIAAQTIQTVGGQSGPLATIAAGLKPGDSLAAQVLARNPAGLTLVALAGKQVHLQLPQTLAPGTLLTLTVQQGTNGLQFLIQPQTASAQPTAANPSAASGQTTATPQPAATSATATTPAQTTSATAQPAAAAASVVRTVASTPLPMSSAQQALLPPLVNARSGLPVPAPHGATAGQVLTAQVMSTPTPSTAIISLGAQELPVSLSAPAQPGTSLPLVVQSAPLGLQLAHAPPGSVPLPGSSPATITSPSLQGAPSAPTAQPAPTAVAAPVATPGAGLAQASLASLGNQNSVSALLASVLRLGDRTRELPGEVQRAVQRLTGSALPLEAKPPSAQALQQAIARSGAFLESRLAGGSGDNGVANDLKAILLVLRRSLGNWLGSDTRPGVLSGKQPPLPQPGATPRAPAPQSTVPLADNQPITEIGKSLLSQTDAALSRLRLHQMASLPDRMDGAAGAKQDIHLEVPITLGQQAGVLSLVITRDEDGNSPDKQKDSWRVQFAINASVIGEVGAEVGLLAGRTNVVLSAVDADAVTALNDGLGELTEALEAVGLTPGILRVRRQGAAPPQASGFKTGPTPSGGHYLDRDT